MSSPRPILIAGPTASGKSALALRLAERVRGVVINADSMQVYRELAIITARPSAEDEARAPHRLYGHVPAREAYSVARWLADAEIEIRAAAAAGLRPIVVGGTGLYFKALTDGLSPIPAIPPEIRTRWRTALAEEGAAALHRQLSDLDSVMAGRLQPGDGQRIVRALEVILATGQSLADWQAVPGSPVVPLAEADALVLEIARPDLHERCDRRFDAMMAAGALDEVRALARQGLDPDLPAMRALGVPPLLAHLTGELPLGEAVALGKQQTRQYVKRQQTWLARHMMSWNSVQLEVNVEIDRQIDRLIDC